MFVLIAVCIWPAGTDKIFKTDKIHAVVIIQRKMKLMYTAKLAYVALNGGSSLFLNLAKSN